MRVFKKSEGLTGLDSAGRTFTLTWPELREWVACTRSRGASRRRASRAATRSGRRSEAIRGDRQHEVTGVPVPIAKVGRLTRGIETMKQKLKGLAAPEAQMRASGEQQISLTDPDARAMTSQILRQGFRVPKFGAHIIFAKRTGVARVYSRVHMQMTAI